MARPRKLPIGPKYDWQKDFAPGWLFRWVRHFSQFDPSYRNTISSQKNPTPGRFGRIKLSTKRGKNG